MTAQQASTPRRKPGRPKGSTTKPVARRGTTRAAAAGEVITEAEAPTNAIVVSTSGSADGAMTVKQVEKRLGAIATSIVREFGKGIDAQFAIGRLLIEARALMPSDNEFGAWLDAQDFPFERRTAGRLREAAEREAEVRQFIADRAAGRPTVKDVSISGALQALNAPVVPAELKDVGKRVRTLLAEEPEPTNGFVAFQKCANDLDLETFTVNELAEFATIIQALVVSYTAERKRRSA